MRASTSPAFARQGSIVAAALLLSLATGMRLLFLDWIPGLNGDEAMAGLKAHQILVGQADWTGLVPYTGGLYEYALALFMWLLGTSVFGLRFFPALMGAVTVWIVYKDLRSKGDGATAFWGALLFGSSPLVLCYNRLAVDNYPFLLSVPVWSLILLERSKWNPVLLIPCGFLMGFLVWCHFLGVAVMVPLLVFFALIRRGGIPASCRIYTLSLLVTALPVAARIAEIQKNQDAFLPEALWTRPLRLLSALPQEAMDLLFMVYKTLDGTFVFLRFTGEVLLQPLPVLPAMGLLVLVLGLATGRSGITRWALPIFLGIIVGIFLLAPYTSIRYLAVANICLVFLAVRWLVEIAKLGRWSRMGVAVVLSATALYQVALVGINYFYAFSRTGGIPTLFALDMQGRRQENSVHMMENRDLYERLCHRLGKAAAEGRILADPNLAHAMAFYDLKRSCLKVVPLYPGEKPRSGDWLLLYRMTQWRDDQSFLASLRRSGLSIKESQELSDTKYMVLRVR